MADSSELAFVKTHLNTLGSLPVHYPNDYLQPPQNTLKKIPPIPVELPSPPQPKKAEETSVSETISLSFKVAKPPKTFTLPISPADSIATVKEQLASQPGAPPANAQRLLHKGKALADGKLLKEYAVKDGDVINLMLKPGFEWSWDEKASAPSQSAKDKDGDVPMKIDLGVAPTTIAQPTASRSGHGRIPSVVLCPSPSTTPQPLHEPTTPIPLTLDTTLIPSPSDQMDKDAYQQKIESPEFWDRLYAFLKLEFVSQEDAANAFETFLLGSKGSLTPSAIAKIRDTVGIMGMAGT